MLTSLALALSVINFEPAGDSAAGAKLSSSNEWLQVPRGLPPTPSHKPFSPGFLPNFQGQPRSSSNASPITATKDGSNPPRRSNDSQINDARGSLVVSPRAALHTGDQSRHSSISPPHPRRTPALVPTQPRPANLAPRSTPAPSRRVPTETKTTTQPKPNDPDKEQQPTNKKRNKL